MEMKFHNSEFEKLISTFEEGDVFLRGLLQSEEVTFFVTRPTNERLHVVCTRRGCVIIYANYNDPYIALDASKTANWVARTKKLVIDGQPTIFFENILLKKREVYVIVKKFCEGGGLYPGVYWLKEGTEPC